jgi:hypothetical protein
MLQCIESAETLAAEKRVALSLDPRVLRGWALLAPDGIEVAIASYRAALADPAKHPCGVKKPRCVLLSFRDAH